MLFPFGVKERLGLDFSRRERAIAKNNLADRHSEIAGSTSPLQQARSKIRIGVLIGVASF
jgi:hypothetical protein